MLRLSALVPALRGALIAPSATTISSAAASSSSPVTVPYFRASAMFGSLRLFSEGHSDFDKVEKVKAQPGEPLEDHLKRLINMDNVVLFMKGNRAQPMCGFSFQMVQLLDSLDVKYSTFNILEDEEVRQGLKAYSSWPTYPQLYHQGELLGGLDVVKDMGVVELTEMLKS